MGRDVCVPPQDKTLVFCHGNAADPDLQIAGAVWLYRQGLYHL